MHRHRSKRSEVIRFVLTYTLVPVIIVSLCTVLVLYMVGWRYNIAERTASQGGLMQLNSRPGGATVTLNGTALSGKTSTRQDVSAGTHTVAMERDGYLPWQKSVTIEPGKILWLNYARLIPKQIDVESVHQFDKLDGAMAAAYGQGRMLLQPSKSEGKFVLVKAGNSQAPITEVSIPDDQVAVAEKDQPSTFAMKAWESKARYAMITQTHGDLTDWIVVDTSDPDRSQNINKIIETPIDRAEFDVDNSRMLYVQSQGNLYRLDLTRKTVSEPLVSSIQSFRQSQDGVITFVGIEGAQKRVVGYYTTGAVEPKHLLLASDNPKDILQAEMVEHTGRQYLVTRLNEQLTISRIRLQPSDSNSEIKLSEQQRFTLPTGAGELTVSDDNRFVLVQKDASFVTYDFELRHFTTVTQVGNEKPTPVKWLDNHLLWSDRGGVLHTYEFDGENGHPIMDVASGYDATLSPDGRYLYAITKSGDGWSLSRARLVLP